MHGSLLQCCIFIFLYVFFLPCGLYVQNSCLYTDAGYCWYFFIPWFLSLLPEKDDFPSSLFTSWFMSKLTESFGGIRVKFETNIFNARVVIKQLKEQIKKICTEGSDWLRDWFYYFSRRWVVMAVNLLIIISEAPSSINSKGTARCKNLPAIRSNKRQQMCKEKIELNNPTLAGYGISHVHFYLGGGGVPHHCNCLGFGGRERGRLFPSIFSFFLFLNPYCLRFNYAAKSLWFWAMINY